MATWIKLLLLDDGAEVWLALPPAPIDPPTLVVETAGEVVL